MAVSAVSTATQKSRRPPSGCWARTAPRGRSRSQRSRPKGEAVWAGAGKRRRARASSSPSCSSPGRAAPSARALTRCRRRRRPGDCRDHRDRAGDQVSERPADRHAQGGGDPGGVERRPGGARDRSERQSNRAGASGRHTHPADVTARGARRTGRPRDDCSPRSCCTSSATTTPGLREPQRPAEVACCVAGDDANTAHLGRAKREHSGAHACG